MAKYRSIHVKIWDDPDFESYSSDKKLVFIYLCTNPSTSESGIYAVTPKKITDNTIIKLETVIDALKTMKNVMWDEKLNYVYIRRFRVYNGGGAPENVKKAIVTEFLQSSTLPFWNNFVEDYPEFKDCLLATGKPLMPSLPLNTNSNTISNSKEPLTNGSPTDSQQKKIKYGQFSNVMLKESEYTKLVERFGKTEATEMIESFSESLQSNKTYQKKYTDHYATILSWKRRDDKNRKTAGGYHGTNAAYKNQPKGTSETPHAIDGDAEAAEG